MKTKANRSNQVFEVTFKKMFETSYGLRFMLDEKENVSESEMCFNEADVHCHMLNVGCVIYVFDEMDEATL